MALLLELSSLALTQVLNWAASADGVKFGMDGSVRIAAALARHFTDHSQKLNEALKKSNDRAWQALELALAGPSWWNGCKAFLVPAEARAFQKQVEQFLDTTPLSELVSNTQVRQQCIRDLQGARKKGLLAAGRLDPQELAERTGAFARFADPQGLLDAEWQAVGRMAEALRQAGHVPLAGLLERRPANGCSLLVAGVRYFFRREVETDQELFQGLTFTKMEGLARAQEDGFAGLHEALAGHGRRIEELLGDVRFLLVETREDVLDIKTEMQRQGLQFADLSQAVLKALEDNQLARRELRPSDSLSLRGDGERQLVKTLVARYRSLPEDQRQQTPALLNALAKLEVASGDFGAARRDFETVAALVGDGRAQAEARFNAYQAALEQRQWPEALAAIREAARLDPQRYAPFPLAKYEPERILGAGGFGVAFLCRHRRLDSPVVVKSLRLDGLQREVAEVFREARVLEELDHPAIIRLRDCDSADPEGNRPFLVMDYFDGQNLADHVARHGPLSPAELLALARPVAEGLLVAHRRSILHRDVKPGNLLVRRDQAGWRVKLIDFGLALKQDVIYASVKTPGSALRSVIGSSVAGTIDYAAPEQLGRLPGVVPGPTADVYGFAKTCSYALFKTTQPLSRHWQSLPRPLAELLERCLEETPANRPAGFAEVLDRLRRITIRPKQQPLRVLEVIEEPPPVVQPVEDDSAVSVQEVVPVEESEEADTVLPAEEGGGAKVRLVFPGEKNAIVNESVEVFLDDRRLGSGRLHKGFEFRTAAVPGNHNLELKLMLRKRLYLLQLMRAGSYEVRLRYDPLWNNFTDRIDVEYQS